MPAVSSSADFGRSALAVTATVAGAPIATASAVSVSDAAPARSNDAVRTLVRAPRSDAPLARDVMHDASIAPSAHGITRGIVIALIRVVDR